MKTGKEASTFQLINPEARQSAWEWVRERVVYLRREGWAPLQITIKPLSRKLQQNAAIHAELQKLLDSYEIVNRGLAVADITDLKRLAMHAFLADTKPASSPRILLTLDSDKEFIVVHDNLETSKLGIRQADEFIAFIPTLPTSPTREHAFSPKEASHAA